MASMWNTASEGQRRYWLRRVGISEHFSARMWNELSLDVQRGLAPEMKEGKRHHGFRCASCGDWDCGFHNPCEICGLNHSPGENCY